MTTAVYECEVCDHEIVETEVGHHPNEKVLDCEVCGERRTFRLANA